MTDLASHWNGVQFNVVGDGSSSIAKFNKGSSIAIRLQVDTGNPLVNPLCVLSASTTAESNTLNLAAAPSQTPPPVALPSIIFAESNAPNSGSASCHVVDAAP